MKYPTTWMFCLPLLIVLGLAAPCAAAQAVVAVRVTDPPMVDGIGDDAAWENSAPTITHDPIADIDIQLKALHGTERIYLLIQFPDPDESRLHKPWVWNAEIEMYEAGKEREDTFVLKWALGADVGTLSVYADQPHHADVWFWKANRTDPQGFADDKTQFLSTSKAPKSQKVTSAGGRTMYLQRKGDAGESAYNTRLLIDYDGEKRAQYVHRMPTGSRADVEAKGVWKDGQWTIEWSRGLTTQDADDVQFELSERYLFGVSRYEIAARMPDPSLSQPLYGTGDVGEPLTLTFAP